MYGQYRIGGVLLMGGEGRRFGSATPKQFHFLGERRVYQYALNTFLKMGVFDEILLVCHPSWKGEIEEGPQARVIEGGNTRQESSYLGVKGFLDAPEIVVIHDAVRPFVTEEIIFENIRGAIAGGAVDTCIPCADTLVYAPEKKWIELIPRREDFLRGQTPQTFQRRLILEAHEKALEKGVVNATDDCRLVLDAGGKVQVVLGDERNFKITSEFDLEMAEKRVSGFFHNQKTYP
jgi:2-C-methyl-D-erythritol 4-phosphate cytidylyltransferase